jgi:hypothetical protein
MRSVLTLAKALSSGPGQLACYPWTLPGKNHSPFSVLNEPFLPLSSIPPGRAKKKATAELHSAVAFSGAPQRVALQFLGVCGQILGDTSR